MNRLVLVKRVAALIVGLGLVACSSDSDNIIDEPIRDSSNVDTAFRDAVLEDGVVSRDEMEQALGNLFHCLRDEGLVGSVWYDLDHSNSYASDLKLADSSVDVDTAGDMIPEKLYHCEEMYTEVMMVFSQSRPEEQLADGNKDAVLACVRESVPRVFEKVDPEWDYETLRLWLYHETERFGADDYVTAVNCVNFFGSPWTDLANW